MRVSIVIVIHNQEITKNNVRIQNMKRLILSYEVNWNSIQFNLMLLHYVSSSIKTLL